MDFDWNNTDSQNSFVFHTDALKQYLNSAISADLYCFYNLYG